MKNRILIIFLAILLIFSNTTICIAEELLDHELKSLEVNAEQNSNPLKGVIRGRVDYDEQKENSDLFTGEIEEIKQGAKLKMTVTSVLSSGLNAEGDEFFAEVTDDFATENGGVMLPSGTIAHGTVTKIENSKRLGRDGAITLKFDYLITPDERKIPIDAKMTTKRHAAAETAKIVLEDTAYTMAGGVIGGLLALKFLGLGTAIASKGSTVAGGAGVGAVVGLTAAMVRKGHEVLIAPGDEIKVKIVQEMELPVMTDEAIKDTELLLEGLDVKISGYILEKDPFGELNTITLTIDVENKTKRSFSSFDMALLSEYKTVYYASPFGNTDLWFKKIVPNSRLKGKLSFSVDSPKKKHWLVFYDNRTRKPLAKFSLKNAEREINKNGKK